MERKGWLKVDLGGANSLHRVPAVRLKENTDDDAEITTFAGSITISAGCYKRLQIRAGGTRQKREWALSHSGHCFLSRHEIRVSHDRRALVDEPFQPLVVDRSCCVADNPGPVDLASQPHSLLSPHAPSACGAFDVLQAIPRLEMQAKRVRVRASTCNRASFETVDAKKLNVKGGATVRVPAFHLCTKHNDPAHTTHSVTSVIKSQHMHASSSSPLDHTRIHHHPYLDRQTRICVSFSYPTRSLNPHRAKTAAKVKTRP